MKQQLNGVHNYMGGYSMGGYCSIISYSLNRQPRYKSKKF